MSPPRASKMAPGGEFVKRDRVWQYRLPCIRGSPKRDTVIVEWDVFLIASVGRYLLGLITAVAFGILGLVVWWMWILSPPIANPAAETNALIATVGAVAAAGTGLVWYSSDPVRGVRFVTVGLGTAGAFLGAWAGYELGFDRGIQQLIDSYSNLPDLDPLVDVHTAWEKGVTWSIGGAGLLANGAAIAVWLYRNLRSRSNSII